MSGKAVEAAGDVHTLLLDKTGTITMGDRQATEFIPLQGCSANDLVQAAYLASVFRHDAGRSHGRHFRRKARCEARLDAGWGASPRLLGADAHERRRSAGRADHPQRGDQRRGASRGRGVWHAGAAGPAGGRRQSGQEGGDAVGRCRRRQDFGRDRVVGRSEARHPRAPRAAARHGNPHRHGDGRQSGHRPGDRRASRSRRIRGGGEAGGKAPSDPTRAGRRAAWWR